jgi:hypothetical protein
MKCKSTHRDKRVTEVLELHNQNHYWHDVLAETLNYLKLKVAFISVFVFKKTYLNPEIEID